MNFVCPWDSLLGHSSIWTAPLRNNQIIPSFSFYLLLSFSTVVVSSALVVLPYYSGQMPGVNEANSKGSLMKMRLSSRKSLLLSFFFLLFREVTTLLLFKKKKKNERNKQLVFNDSVRPNYKTSTTYFDLCVSVAWIYLKTFDSARTYFGFVYIYLLNV